MFFFIGGLQPKTVALDDLRRICPACGLAQAHLKRVDQYLSLFFIPLLRVKKGEPVVLCDRCGTQSAVSGLPGSTPSVEPPRELFCRSCGRALDPRFNYCPHCGTKV